MKARILPLDRTAHILPDQIICGLHPWVFMLKDGRYFICPMVGRDWSDLHPMAQAHELITLFVPEVEKGGRFFVRFGDLLRPVSDMDILGLGEFELIQNLF